MRRIAALMVLLPVIVVAAGWAGSKLDVVLSSQHPTVFLAEEIMLEDSGQRTESTVETRAFRASGKPNSELMTEASLIRSRFSTGGWLLGGFIGLIFSVKLINLNIRKKETDYVADNGNCFSCARCFSYCPMEQVRRGLVTPEQAHAMGREQ